MSTTEVLDRITELEIKLTYQQRLTEELNQAVVELRAELDATGKRLRRLEQQQLQGTDGAANEPPPHY
jgi:uncharacterized coiled-coil protein SlyX